MPGGPFRLFVLVAGRLTARLSRRVGAGFHSSGGGCLVGVGRRSWSGGDRKCLQSLECGGDHLGPGPVASQTEPEAAAGGDELGGGGE